MRRDIRAIGRSRVGNPPVGARLRSRVARRPGIVGDDGPPAGTAPHPARRRVPADRHGAGARDAHVAGRGATVGESLVSFADPSGGDRRRRQLDRGLDQLERGRRDPARSTGPAAARGRARSSTSSRTTTIFDNVSPRAVARPDGSFVAVWIGDRNGDGDTVLRSATRSPSGVWTAEDVSDLTGSSLDLNGLGAGADGSVTVVARSRRSLVLEHEARARRALGGPRDRCGIAGGRRVRGRAQRRRRRAQRRSLQPRRRASAPRTGRRAAGWGGSGDGVDHRRHRDRVRRDRQAGLLLHGRLGRGGRRRAQRRAPIGRGRRTGARFPTRSRSSRPRPGPATSTSRPAPNGRQLAAWQQSSETADQIGAALRSPGGDWTGRETVSGGSTGNGFPHAAITTTDVPVVAWGSSANNSADANGSYRDAGGHLERRKLLGGSQDDSVSLGELDADGDGNALTAFRNRRRRLHSRIRRRRASLRGGLDPGGRQHRPIAGVLGDGRGRQLVRGQGDLLAVRRRHGRRRRVGLAFLRGARRLRGDRPGHGHGRQRHRSSPGR